MNTRDWVEIEYQPEERVNIDLLIEITEVISQTRFKANYCQANRPIFNSNYKSITFKVVDTDFIFDYAELQAIGYAENTYAAT